MTENIKMPTVDMLSPAEIFAKACNLAETKLKAGYARIFLLGILAGAFIAFGALFFLIVNADPNLGFAGKKVLGGIVFCTGLYLVISAGSELFTGDCMSILGLWSKRIGIGQLVGLLVVVWLGNLVGSVAVAAMIMLCGTPATGAIGATAVTVASGKVGLPLLTMAARGVMCNILVCLAVWCSYGAKTVVDKLFSVLLPISFFVAAGFEHSVANMFFLPFGYLCQQAGFVPEAFSPENAITILGIARNLCVVSVANAIAAFIFVAGIYYLIYNRKAAK